MDEKQDIKNENPGYMPAFFSGVIVGSVLQGIGNYSKLEFLTLTFVTWGAGIPILDKYISENTWKCSYKESISGVAGMLLGSILINYFKY